MSTARLYFFRLLGFCALSMVALSVQAASTVGTIETSNNYSLVHDGVEAPNASGSDDWLFFPIGAPIEFEISGDMLTAAGPQEYQLTSANGASADFVLLSLTLDLSGPNGMAGGTMDYTIDGVPGVFTFIEETYGDTRFNSSRVNGDSFQVWLWGGDVANDLGIDFSIEGVVVPIPGAFLLLGSALLGLGFIRRR